jgi:hypothetical protein
MNEARNNLNENDFNENNIIKPFLAFFIIYKEVFNGANNSLKKYIEKIKEYSQTQSGGGLSSQQIEISPLYNAVKINKPSTELHGINNIFSNVKKNLTDAVAMSEDVLFDYSQDFITKTVKYGTIVILTMLILQQEDVKNTPTSEISNVVNKKVNIYSRYLEKLLDDPDHIKNMQSVSLQLAKITGEFTEIAGEVIKAVEPSILDFINKLEESAKKISDKSADGIVRTGTSLIQSIFAEIPGLGGIIDLIITGGIAFNSYMKVVKIATNEGNAITEDFKEIVNVLQTLLDKKKASITGLLNKFDEATTMPSIPKVSLPLPKLETSYPMSGGALAKKHKNIQKKIMRTSKRLSDTLNKFIGNNKRKTKRNKIKHYN